MGGGGGREKRDLGVFHLLESLFLGTGREEGKGTGPAEGRNQAGKRPDKFLKEGESWGKDSMCQWREGDCAEEGGLRGIIVAHKERIDILLLTALNIKKLEEGGEDPIPP